MRCQGTPRCCSPHALPNGSVSDEISRWRPPTGLRRARSALTGDRSVCCRSPLQALHQGSRPVGLSAGHQDNAPTEVVLAHRPFLSPKGWGTSYKSGTNWVRSFEDMDRGPKRWQSYIQTRSGSTGPAANATMPNSDNALALNLRPASPLSAQSSQRRPHTTRNEQGSRMRVPATYLPSAKETGGSGSRCGPALKHPPF